MDSRSFGEKSSKLNYKIGKSFIIPIKKMINRKFLTVFGLLLVNNTAKKAINNIYIEKE